MIRTRSLVPLGLALALLLARSAPATATGGGATPYDFFDDVHELGFSMAVNMDVLPDGRLLVVELKTGRIRNVGDGAIRAPDPVGTIDSLRTFGPEQGLLGIAVDPRWPVEPYVYVHFNHPDGPSLRLRRYALFGDLKGTADGSLVLLPESKREILVDLPDERPYHDGGTIQFGPDGMLYLATGDDGFDCTAQDLADLRGKILRLDVTGVPDGPGPTPDLEDLVPPDNPFAAAPDPRTRLVWAYGLRNPYAFDIDPETGWLYIADVGELAYEELDIAHQPGMNFGWPYYEANIKAGTCAVGDSTNVTFPVWSYAHVPNRGGNAILTAGLFRRPPGSGPIGFPDAYLGNVFVMDLIEGALVRLVCSWGGCTIAPAVAGQPSPEHWGESFTVPTRGRFGPDGNLWLLTFDNLHHIVHLGPPVAAPATPAPAPGAAVALAAIPVPARGPVTFRLRAPAGAAGRLVVHDVRGRRVRAFAVPPGSGGTVDLGWDRRSDAGAPVGAGLHVARYEAAGEVATRRLALLGAGGGAMP